MTIFKSELLYSPIQPYRLQKGVFCSPISKLAVSVEKPQTDRQQSKNKH